MKSQIQTDNVFVQVVCQFHCAVRSLVLCDHLETSFEIIRVTNDDFAILLQAIISCIQACSEDLI